MIIVTLWDTWSYSTISHNFQLKNTNHHPSLSDKNLSCSTATCTSYLICWGVWVSTWDSLLLKCVNFAIRQERKKWSSKVTFNRYMNLYYHFVITIFIFIVFLLFFFSSIAWLFISIYFFFRCPINCPKNYCSNNITSFDKLRCEFKSLTYSFLITYLWVLHPASLE